MVKQTQKSSRLLPGNCLSVFEHVVELVLKGLNTQTNTGHNSYLHRSKTCITRAIASWLSKKTLFFVSNYENLYPIFTRSFEIVTLSWTELFYKCEFWSYYSMVYFWEWKGYRRNFSWKSGDKGLFSLISSVFNFDARYIWLHMWRLAFSKFGQNTPILVLLTL